MPSWLLLTLSTSHAVVLITPGPPSCAVVIASAPRFPARLTDNREPPPQDDERGEATHAPSDRLAYSVAETAKALGLSRDMIYQQLRQGASARSRSGSAGSSPATT
jgi:hypothetical protein